MRFVQGRSEFTRAEIEELRRLIREKQTADRSRQKALRAKMRGLGFYISDFAFDYGGFVVSDLDELIGRGAITTTDADAPKPSLRASAPFAGRRARQPRSGKAHRASDPDTGST